MHELNRCDNKNNAKLGKTLIIHFSEETINIAVRYISRSQASHLYLYKIVCAGTYVYTCVRGKEKMDSEGGEILLAEVPKCSRC